MNLQHSAAGPPLRQPRGAQRAPAALESDDRATAHSRHDTAPGLDALCRGRAFGAPPARGRRDDQLVRVYHRDELVMVHARGAGRPLRADARTVGAGNDHAAAGVHRPVTGDAGAHEWRVRNVASHCAVQFSCVTATHVLSDKRIEVVGLQRP